MVVIENERLRVSIAEVGALLTSVYLKKEGKEALWQAQEAKSWPSQDVVMFPVVGIATYDLEGVHHEGGHQHGFARDSRFSVLEKKADQVSLLLKDDEKSWALYPYHFALAVTYSLKGASLHSHFEVKNLSDKVMPFMLGNHPGYRYHFNDGAIYLKEGSLHYLPVRQNLTRAEEVFPYQGKLVLTKELFKRFETIVLDDNGAPKVDTGFGYLIQYHFKAPYTVIWSHPEAGDFLCIEPWWGINQYEGQPLELAKRKNVNLLKPQAKQSFDNEVEFLSK
jgi:galactose mutarotase-like enzyme